MAEQSATCPQCGKRVGHGLAGRKPAVCPSCGVALGPADLAGTLAEADPLIGQTLGEFEIVALLGRGGMGAAYKAYQPSLGRFVAVKVLPQWMSRDATFAERFQREARAAAAISHPNIIQVHAVGQDKGCQYIAMELIEGESLADLLDREGRLSPGRALGIMKEVASGLADGHRVGILHRDIKPANILLDSRGRAKVADFGLAKQTGVDVTVTTTGQSLGTPLYLPPEVARGGKTDARSDLYSLGVTFYQALSGKPPFDGATPAELILKHDQDAAPPLRSFAPDAPSALCRIIHRLLRKDPAGRYESVEELIEALNKVDVPIEAAPRRPRRATHRGVVAGLRAPWRRIAVLAALAAAAAVLVLGVVLARPRGAGHPAPQTHEGHQSSVKPRASEQGTKAGPRVFYTEWPFESAEARRRQAETAAALGVDVEETLDLGNGVKMAFILIPLGEFLMGSPPTATPEQLEKLFGKDEYLDYVNDFPQHRVRITRPFWLGKTEVTQEQWQAVMGANPSEFADRDRDPVENVSWEDCRQFLQKLSARSEQALRLPTEAEWEYACRAGAAGGFHFGDSATGLDAYAWHGRNAGGTTHPAGETKPNAWGLHDMAGSVWEWCEDGFGPYGQGTETAPKGFDASGYRALRGGSWVDAEPGYFLSAHRCCNVPSHRAKNVGFRVARGIAAPSSRPRGPSPGKTGSTE